jgi:ATP-dependent RNA circularization protein (DNA/RNA ligase family)
MWIDREYTKIPNIYVREQFGKNKLIEGEYSSDELRMLAGISWVWTEKVDGTNVRIIWDGYRVSFAGRTANAQMPPHLTKKLDELFGGESKEELFEQKFGETPCVLFGEGYGEKIQKGGGLYGPVNFVLFDVFCGGMWLKRDSVEDIASTFGIGVVPVVGTGTLPNAVEYIRKHPKSQLRDAELEGIVCRPEFELADRRGNRIIVKIKCRDFDKAVNSLG